jgi:putative oxidoreductase
MARTLIQSFLYGREHAPVRSTEVPWARLVLVGRTLLATIFIISGIAKLMDWSSTAAYMEAAGLPMVDLLLPIAAAVEILGGLSVMTGTFARAGALALVVFLIPTSLVFHDFWNLEGMERTTQMAAFMKNVSIAGGLLVVLGYGAGKVSVDRKLQKRFDQPPAG